MITLFYSAEPELARRSALKILKKDYPDRDDMNYLCLNMADSSLKELLDELDILPFGVERRAILAEDCSFLLKKGKEKGGRGKKSKGKDDELLDTLAAYCKNPNPNIDLYLVAYGAELQEGSPIVEAIQATGKLCPLAVPATEEWADFALRYFAKNGCPSDKETALELAKRVDGDYGRFLFELQKLAAYASHEPLSLSAVESLVSPRLEDNTFEMSNALLKGDLSKAISVYHDLLLFSVDEVRLINQLATQFRFLDQVLYLQKRGLDANAIALELHVKYGRVMIALRDLSSATAEGLSRAQEQIYQAEKAILKGEADPRFAFERFIANFSLR